MTATTSTCPIGTPPNNKILPNRKCRCDGESSEAGSCCVLYGVCSVSFWLWHVDECVGHVSRLHATWSVFLFVCRGNRGAACALVNVCLAERSTRGRLSASPSLGICICIPAIDCSKQKKTEKLVRHPHPSPSNSPSPPPPPFFILSSIPSI